MWFGGFVFIATIGQSLHRELVFDWLFIGIAVIFTLFGYFIMKNMYAGLIEEVFDDGDSILFIYQGTSVRVMLHEIMRPD
jgi:hypothetical protein